MNLAICARDIRGGLRSHLELLLDQLEQDDGIGRVHLLSATPTPFRGGKVVCHRIGVIGRSFMLREPWFIWRCSRRLKSLTGASAVDVIDVHQPALLRHPGVPAVYTVHITHRQFSRKTHGGILGRGIGLAHRLYTGVDRRQMAVCDRVHFVSRRALESFAGRYPSLADKFVYIGNFFDEARFHPLAHDRVQSFKRERGIAEDAFLLLFSGRLDPMKNIPGLLRAVERLRSQGDNIQLLVAGSGRLVGAVRRHAGCVYLGELGAGALNLAYNAADLTVLPSACENFPAVVLESFAAGTPVLATDVGDVARILPSELILRDASPETIAAAVRSFRRAETARVRSWVRDVGTRVRRDFSAGALVRRKLDLYRQLAVEAVARKR